MGMGEGQREKERKRGNPKQALRCQSGALPQAWTHKLSNCEIMTWAKIKCWMLNRLSHPGPSGECFHNRNSLVPVNYVFLLTATCLWYLPYFPLLETEILNLILVIQPCPLNIYLFLLSSFQMASNHSLFYFQPVFLYMFCHSPPENSPKCYKLEVNLI